MHSFELDDGTYIEFLNLHNNQHLLSNQVYRKTWTFFPMTGGYVIRQLLKTL